MLPVELEDRGFKALGHRDRRALLRAIGADERPVGELAEHTDLEQPVASQHLKVLRDAGLVYVRIDGNRRLYSIDFGRFGEIRRFLDDFWNARLAVLKSTAEAGHEPSDGKESSA